MFVSGLKRMPKSQLVEKKDKLQKHDNKENNSKSNRAKNKANGKAAKSRHTVIRSLNSGKEGKSNKPASKKPKSLKVSPASETRSSYRSRIEDLPIVSNDLKYIDASKLTRVYAVPSERFKTEEEIIKYYGYELGEQLGHGAFGIIYVAKHFRTQLKVACKKVDLKKSKNKIDSSKVDDMKNELFILKKIQSPYIVKLYAHFIVNAHLYMFMKLANSGTFRRYIKNKGVLVEKEAQVFFAQTLNAVEHMHSLHIAHRDIKLDNILLYKHSNDRYTIMLIDFGLSRVIKVSNEGKVTLSKTNCGTPDYMAPEVLLNKPYNAFLADIWALGITLFEMLNAKYPFYYEDDDKKMAARQLAKEWNWTNRMAKDPSDGLKDIMSQLLEPIPDKRISMAKLVEHPWLFEDLKFTKECFNNLRTKSLNSISTN